MSQLCHDQLIDVPLKICNPHFWSKNGASTFCDRNYIIWSLYHPLLLKILAPGLQPKHRLLFLRRNVHQLMMVNTLCQPNKFWCPLFQQKNGVLHFLKWTVDQFIMGGTMCQLRTVTWLFVRTLWSLQQVERKWNCITVILWYPGSLFCEKGKILRVVNHFSIPHSG